MRATAIKFSWNEPGKTNHACPDSAATVSNILLERDDARLDYTVAKLAFDRLIDAEIDTNVTVSMIDTMAEAARNLAGEAASPNSRLVALRKLLYESGPWNDHRPFAYDHNDPLGQDVANKLLANYLRTRRGNCVSMPILFLILADKLDLDVTLVTAPLHILARYRGEDDQTFNIEPSNGGQPARNEWYRQSMQISDRAVESGLYLRSLSRRENVALMATTIVEHLLDQREFAQALAVSDVILRHAPRDGYTMVKKGTACSELLHEEIERKYLTPAQIPAPILPRYRQLIEMSRSSFATAEAMGWEPVE